MISDGWLADVGLSATLCHRWPMRRSVQATVLLALTLACLALGGLALKTRHQVALVENELREAQATLSAVRRVGTSEQGCVERGGTVSHRSFGSPYCKIAFRDAGRACSDMSECLGGCVALDGPQTIGKHANGTCKAANVQGACTAYLVGGRVSWSDCVD